jgi:hypothetical protein
MRAATKVAVADLACSNGICEAGPVSVGLLLEAMVLGHGGLTVTAADTERQIGTSTEELGRRGPAAASACDPGRSRPRPVPDRSP